VSRRTSRIRNETKIGRKWLYIRNRNGLGYYGKSTLTRQPTETVNEYEARLLNASKQTPSDETIYIKNLTKAYRAERYAEVDVPQSERARWGNLVPHLVRWVLGQG
jgi:hypothetical protein